MNDLNQNKYSGQMGINKTDVKAASNSITDQVMETLYSLTNRCKQNLKQTQTANVTISWSVGAFFEQEQNIKADITCLANGNLSSNFDQDFKKQMEQDVKSKIDGIGGMSFLKSNISEQVANKLYAKNNVQQLQETINEIEQNQVVNAEIEQSMFAKVTQKQNITSLINQVSDMVNDVVLKSAQEQSMTQTVVQETKGVDVTAIATTAIKTAGEVAKSLTGMFFIGAMVFIVLIIGGVIVIIMFIRKNCGSIKKSLARANKIVPLPLKIQFAVLRKVVGIVCPGDGQPQPAPADAPAPIAAPIPVDASASPPVTPTTPKKSWLARTLSKTKGKK